MFERAAWDPYRFWLLVSIALGIKLLLAARLPLTGDEAYFLQYARHVDWGGFYDHPAMVGWMLWLMEQVGTHPVILRLPAILTSLVVATGVYLVARSTSEGHARLVALLILFTPVYLINVLITSDTGLILFGFLSALCFYTAIRSDRLLLYPLAGVLLGLAFLSKYFAILLGVAYLLLIPWLSRRQRTGLFWLVAAAVPFGLWNLMWNYHHCWNHIMFNVYNRTGDGFEPAGLLVYLLTLVYLFALPAWYLFRERRFVRQAAHGSGQRLLASLGLIPLLLFVPISLFATVGLHWLLLFVPLLYPLYVWLSLEDLGRSLRFLFIFAMLHVVILAGLLFMPLHWLEGRDVHRDAIFYLQPDEYAAALPDLAVDFHAMDSYSRAAVLGYYSDRHWSVWGTGSVHAREDDRLTDWRQHDGKDMLYVSRRHDIDPADVAPYFERIEQHEFSVRGQSFDAIVGRGFDYTTYRTEVLARIRTRYYEIPAYLPMGGCTFLERHFPARDH